MKSANLGIRTPLSHNISRSPNGWSPSIYWRGIPLERARHTEPKIVRYGSFGHVRCSFDLLSTTASLSHRSSFCAKLIERHSFRSNGNNLCSRYAFMISRVPSRGIDCFATPCKYRPNFLGIYVLGCEHISRTRTHQTENSHTNPHFPPVVHAHTLC